MHIPYSEFWNCILYLGTLYNTDSVQINDAVMIYLVCLIIMKISAIVVLSDLK